MDYSPLNNASFMVQSLMCFSSHVFFYCYTSLQLRYSKSMDSTQLMKIKFKKKKKKELKIVCGAREKQ